MNRFLGAKVAKERLARNLSQQTLADYLELSQEQVAAIEAGEQPLSPSDILLLSDLFDVEPSWFYDV